MPDEEKAPTGMPSTPPKPTKIDSKPIKEKTYALRFVLSLIFGNIFIGCLIYLLVRNVTFFTKGAASISAYDGSTFAGVITALIVFGGLHLWLASSVKKPADEPYKKYQNVLSIIYCSAWALVGLWSLWMAIKSAFFTVILAVEYIVGEP